VVVRFAEHSWCTWKKERIAIAYALSACINAMIAWEGITPDSLFWTGIQYVE